jgi:hypothetical protein
MGQRSRAWRFASSHKNRPFKRFRQLEHSPEPRLNSAGDRWGDVVELRARCCRFDMSISANFTKVTICSETALEWGEWLESEVVILLQSDRVSVRLQAVGNARMVLVAAE